MVDFPLMNLNDLIIVSTILCNVDALQVFEENRNVFVLVTNIDLARVINKTAKLPQSVMKEKSNIDEFEDGDIIH